MSLAETSPLRSLKPVSRHGRITAVSMMKDEGPFVLEWVAHHLAVGFTDLVVYTNDCTDGTDDMLIRLEELGLAYHRRNIIPAGLRPQPSALNYAQEEPLVGSSDWMMVFDADEFLSIKYADGTLDPLLDAAKAQGANGIVITWRIFGSGGVHHWSRDPVTEQYLQAAPADWNKGWGVKTLFQFDPEYWKLGIHRPKMKNKWLETDFPQSVKWLNGSGRPMEDYFKFRGWRSITRTVGYDWVQLNHYAVKSIDSYAIRKFRGNVNNKKDKYNADYWSLQDRNEVRDETMLRYSQKRKDIFDQLLTDPVLNRLHFAALDRAESRLAEFKGTPAYEEMVAGLKAAALVPLEEIVAKPPQARDPEKIAALMSRVEKAAGEKQKAEREAAAQLPVPRGLILRPDPAEDVAAHATWHANHGIELPKDPGYFTNEALDWIERGKLERSLMRHLPRLVEGAKRHIEFGSGCGFRAALLRKSFPEMEQLVQEDHPARSALIRAVWAHNNCPESVSFQLLIGRMKSERLAEFLSKVKPDSILIGDSALSAAEVHHALKSSGTALTSLIIAGNALLQQEEWRQYFPQLAAPKEGEALPEGLFLRHFAPEI